MENEKAIIASMVYNATCADRGLTECEPDDFTSSACRRVFNVISAMRKAGKSIDIVTVGNAFDNDPAFMQDFSEIVTAFYLPSSFDDYVSEIKRARKRREIRRGLAECLQMAEDESDDVYRAAQEMLDRVNSIGGVGVESIASIVDDAVEEMGKRQVGVPSGFPDIDKFTCGLVPGNLVVVAGRPSMGKSTFAVNLAQNLCTKGKTVAFFSLEDSAKSIVRRMVCGLARISMADVRAGKHDAIERAMAARDIIRGYPLFVWDNGVQSAESISRECHSLGQTMELGLIVVDYLGQIRTRERRNSSRQQEIGEVSRAMKLLAKDIGCAVVLVSQLNRGPDARDDKRPRLSDLRESGDIEQDADVVLFPYRPWVYDRSYGEHEASMIIAKNRNGVIGEVDLNWFGEWFLFESVYRNAGGSNG